MLRSIRLLSPLGLALLVTGAAHATDRPSYHAAHDPAATLASPGALRAPRRAASKSAASSVRVVSTDRLRGVPTFVRAAQHPPAQAIPAKLARKASPTHEEAARAHLEDLAPIYSLSPAALDAAVVREVHDTGRGGVVVTLGQEVDGVEVFQEKMKLLLRRDHALVAAGGHLHPAASRRTKAARSRFALPEGGAVAIAFGDLHGAPLPAGSLTDAGTSEGGYRRFGFSPPLAPKAADHRFTRPARLKKVYFPLPDRLVPAYYVELFTARLKSIDVDAYAYVIAADDGRVLYRSNLKAHDAFKYRVWAETTGNGRPLDGPVEDFTPNPTGELDGKLPKYIAPNLVTMDGFNKNPDGGSDPWLAPSATETKGNNVDAYTDDSDPEGFSKGDIRASTTAPGVFDRVYDTALEPTAGDEQRMAAVTQLFYTTNWLHDYFYDSGFDEAAGNAQQSNYGRGGLGSDRLQAQGQDGVAAGQINNANMYTPADGESPVMQMFVWSGPDAARNLDVQPIGSGLVTDAADFGPGNFDVTGPVVLAADGTSPVNDACEPIVNDVKDKIALVDRGTCTFEEKVLAAQAAGAIGVLLANHTPNQLPPFMPGSGMSKVTIPVLSITFEDGSAIKAALGAGPVTAHLTRAVGPKLDGTIDNMVVAHEWGHYLHHRLVDCNLNQCGGESEGWGDFVALALAVREGDDLDGTYADCTYAPQGSPGGGYFGLRRFPYTVDHTKNAMTFKHIADEEPLPTGMPFNDIGIPNSEAHNTGEIWAVMLFEGYVRLLKQSQGSSPRYSFEEARRRMADYVVAGMKLAPTEPTFTEQRDAILAAAYAADPADMLLLAQGFAARGAGSCAKSPDRASLDNSGVVESFEVTPEIAILSVKLDESVKTCDGDAILDAEETGHLTVEIMNAGVAALPSSEIEVSTTATDVAFANGSKVTLGPLEPYAKTTVSFDVSVARKAKDPLPFDVTVSAKSEAACEPEVQIEKLFRVNYDNALLASASDGFESDVDVWHAEGDGADQIWSKAVADDLNHTWRGVDFFTQSDTALVSPPVAAGTGNLVLSFKHRHSFEASPESPGGPDVYWDGAVLEVSTDGGLTWADISSYGDPGYGGTIGDLAGNPLADRQGFVGQNHAWPEMDTVSIDLGTALAGKTVQVRFRIGTDEAQDDFGWEIDEVAFEGLADTPFPRIVADASTCNKPPVASVKKVSPVGNREPVTLDASKSSDPDGDPLTFAWTQTAGPKVDLSSTDAAVVDFVSPNVERATTFTFQVTVSDGASDASAQVSVVVDPKLAPPLTPAGGCGCSVEERPGAAALGPLSLAAILLLARRRRRS